MVSNTSIGFFYLKLTQLIATTAARSRSEICRHGSTAIPEDKRNADIAELMGVSHQTLYNRIEGSGNPSTFSSYTPISDADLNQVVTETEFHHPNPGEVMLAEYLTLEGLRASIH